MKKLLLPILLLLTHAVHSQISLQYSLPDLVHAFSIVHFGYLGDKYVAADPNNNEIDIYSLNFTLEKTIHTPSSLSDASLFYISDNLFDTDSSIEYLASNYSGNGTIFNIHVVKEDGTILLEADSASMSGVNPNFISEFANVYPSADGTKLILFITDYGYKVYSLPGNLPCNDCSGGEFATTAPFNNSMNPGKAIITNPFPNPAGNVTRIDYYLPQGTRKGELVFFTTAGVEIKRFEVTDAFHFIYVSNKDLPSGTYYYLLQTSSGSSDGKKMIVIK